MGVSDSYRRGREFVVEDPTRMALSFALVLLLLDLVRRLVTGDLPISNLAVLVKDGLMRGLVFGLAGIGLSMTYSILNFANFSHGDLFTTGVFSGMSVSFLIAGGFGAVEGTNLGNLALLGPNRMVAGSNLGIGVWTSPVAVLFGAIVAAVATIIVALVIDRVVYKPIRDRSGITLLITSIGVAFVLRYMIKFVYGAAKRGPTASQPTVELAFVDGPLAISTHDVSLFVVAVSLMGGLHFLLQRTTLGKAMRAMSDNKDLARITGIPTERIIQYTWIIGAGLTGIAGFMFALWAGDAYWFRGWILLLPIFAAVILGGIGSIYGAIAGGIVIGLTMSVSVIWIPSGLARAAAFLVMILVLLVRPEGIFAGRTTA